MPNVGSAEDKNQCEKSTRIGPGRAVQPHFTTHDQGISARGTKSVGPAPWLLGWCI